MRYYKQMFYLARETAHVERDYKTAWTTLKVVCAVIKKAQKKSAVCSCSASFVPPEGALMLSDL